MSEKLMIYLFNVGSGDHLMIEFPDKSIGIIDSFFSDSKLDLQEPPVLTYLKYRLQIKKETSDLDKIKIAFLCLTHADHDHIKSVNLLFDLLKKEEDNIELENLFLFGGIELETYKEEIIKLNAEIIRSLDFEEAEEFEKSASRYNEELRAIESFKKYWQERNNKSASYFDDYKEFKKYNDKGQYKAISFGPLASIIKDCDNTNISDLISDIYERVQAFQNENILKLNSKINLKFNRNSISAILGIMISNKKLWFLGDATNKTIESSLKDISLKELNVEKLFFNPDFVKVGHHGASNSTSGTIWDTLFTNNSSKVTLGISAGKHGKNKHPHNQFFEDVAKVCNGKEINYNIYRTNICSQCDFQTKLDGIIDLDFWFQFHGCTIEDTRLKDRLQLDANWNYEINKNKNLLAYIFEFSLNTEEDVKIYKGVSNLIGFYTECVFGDKNPNYCSN